MNRDELTSSENEILSEYIVLEEHSQKILRRMFTEFSLSSRVKMVKHLLSLNRRDIAFSLLRSFAITPAKEEIKQLFDTIMIYASYQNGFYKVAQSLILSLPKEWLIEHIETAANKILADENAGYIEYGFILDIYGQIDKKLADDFANRAKNHADSDIRDLGESYFADES
jgi:hypothetical protein